MEAGQGSGHGRRERSRRSRFNYGDKLVGVAPGGSDPAPGWAHRHLARNAHFLAGKHQPAEAFGAILCHLNPPQTMTTCAITGFLLFEAIALLNFIGALQHIPDGWEDESGFHFGQPARADALGGT